MYRYTPSYQGCALLIAKTASNTTSYSAQDLSTGLRQNNASTGMLEACIGGQISGQFSDALLIYSALESQLGVETSRAEPARAWLNKACLKQ